MLKRLFNSFVFAVILSVFVLFGFAQPAAASTEVPEGYRLMDSGDLGKTFGVDLDPKVVVVESPDNYFKDFPFGDSGIVLLDAPSLYVYTPQFGSGEVYYGTKPDIFPYPDMGKKIFAYNRSSIMWDPIGVTALEGAVLSGTVNYFNTDYAWNTWLYVKDIGNTEPVTVPVAIPDGYRPITSADNHKILGRELEKTIFLNTNIIPDKVSVDNPVTISFGKITNTFDIANFNASDANGFLAVWMEYFNAPSSTPEGAVEPDTGIYLIDNGGWKAEFIDDFYRVFNFYNFEVRGSTDWDFWSQIIYVKDREIPESESNPVGYILNGITNALDQFILFGTFSLWDFITTMLGAFAVIWLLKLLAGG